MSAESDRQFELQIDIAASRDEVFEALTNASILSRWFAPENTFEPEVGGEVVWNWAGHFHWPQRIEILQPGERLRTRYDSAVDDGRGGKAPLFVDFILSGQGGQTTLRLVHSGFGADAAFDDEYEGISHGWPVELRSLRLYLEHHAGSERQLAWSQLSMHTPAQEAWLKVVGPKGLGCGAAITALAEGKPFELATPDGDLFTGRTLQTRAREFCGMASSHGDALLRFWVGEHGGVTHVWLWLACYGQPDDVVAGVQQRWDAMLDRLFPELAAVRDASSTAAGAGESA